MERPPTAVLGIGNVLLGDDALGPYVVALLGAAWRLPDDVTLLDAGTPGIDLGDYIAGRRLVILIDTVKSDRLPGTIQVYGKDELLGHAGAGLRRGGHDPALRDTLVSLEMAGQGPDEVVFIGVVPAGTATGTGLSAAVRAAAPIVACEVVTRLRRAGLAIGRCEPPAVPDIWWEREPLERVA